jgi:dienelactone hydrolase
MEKLYSYIINKHPEYFRIIFVLSLAILMTNVRAKSQYDPNVINELDVIHSQGAGGKDNIWIQFSDAQNSLYHYLSGQAYPLLEKRANVVSGLNTLADWQNRQEWLRTTLKDVVGPFPKKTPLNAKIIRTIDKDDFKVEHIVYESQPGFYVTSSMFIPDGLKGKNPVVIYCSGHSDNGYRAYQTQILNLVKKGFIVFAFDPVDQGERLEYFDPQTNQPKAGGSDLWHSYSGAQALITGSSQIMFMMWDGIRAVDYVLTRNEVDPTRIGITGRSGGGTQSAWIAALDERIYAAAPESYITNFRGLFWGPGPQDAEQEPVNGIVRGIDLADLLLIRAPKPTLIIATTGDYFGIQGFRESAKEASRIYKAYDKEADFEIAEDILPRHGATQKNREAMYAFFQKFLKNPGIPNEEKISQLSEEEMQVTKTGQVYTSFGGETVFSLNNKETEKLIAKLQSSRNDLPKYLSGALNSAKMLSGYQEPLLSQEPVFTGRIQRDGYIIDKYFVKGEGDYIIPYLFMKPDRPNNKALIYLHPSGKSAEAFVGGEMEWFVRNGFTVLAPDLIGIGEMGPGDFRGDSYIEGVSYNVWFASMLIGRSIVGIRAGDVVRLTRLLKNTGGISEVYGFARKEMAPVLLHAAAFDPAITRIALIEPYSSYRSIVMNRFYDPGFVHSTVPAALKAYDLPDLAASLAPRKLLMAGIADGFGKSTDTENINMDLAIIKIAYQNKKADSQLNLVNPLPAEKPYDLYKEWIK